MSKIIECIDLEKTYHDGDRELRILTGVNLEVGEREILAISGPSGVGKSTLLHIMGSLDQPTRGEVRFRGKPLKKTGRRAVGRIRNQDIGFVFQFYHLLPEFTALENVMMPALCKGTRRHDATARAEELLARVGLAERVRHKPGQLSGGEQQRVAIARALYNRPAVLLCDEPTGNLDEATGAGVVDLLWEIHAEESAALVFVTHDESLAARADRWIQIHDGIATERIA